MLQCTPAAVYSRSVRRQTEDARNHTQQAERTAHTTVCIDTQERTKSTCGQTRRGEDAVDRLVCRHGILQICLKRLRKKIQDRIRYRDASTLETMCTSCPTPKQIQALLHCGKHRHDGILHGKRLLSSRIFLYPSRFYFFCQYVD